MGNPKEIFIICFQEEHRRRKKNQDAPDGRRSRLAHGEAEVLHRDGQAVEDLGVDGVVLQVDEVHLFSDLLQGRLGAKRGQIGADVAVRFGSDL